MNEARSSFLALLGNAPDRVLARNLKGPIVERLNEMYPEREPRAAIAHILELATEHGTNPHAFAGFVKKCRPTAESLVNLSRVMGGHRSEIQQVLLEAITQKKSRNFYHGLVKDLVAHPSFDQFKSTEDVELFHVVASLSHDPALDLAGFGIIKTHGLERLRKYYRAGFRVMPPIRVDGHNWWGERLDLSLLGKSPIYDNGIGLEQNRIMNGVRTPLSARFHDDSTVFEINLFIYFARRKKRPSWNDITGAIRGLEQDPGKWDAARILKLLPQLTLDGSLNEFVSMVKALGKDGEAGVYRFIEARAGSIAELNRTLETIAFKRGEGEPINWETVIRDPDSLLKDVYARQLRLHREQFPEKPIDQVRSEFLAVKNGPAISEEELDAAIAMYGEIMQRGTELVGESRDGLRSLIADTKKSPELDMVEFLALARDVARREFGIYPYNTQMLTAILMLSHPERYPKGRFAQVSTGEGKSLVFSILAAAIASKGEGVDIFTSNNYLAGRDARTFASFYRWFGLSAHAFRYRDENRPQVRNADIRYGPCSEFRWAEMIAALDGRQLFAKPGTIGLVDEVDNLLIDEGNTPAVISASGGTFLPRRFYEEIFQYVKEIDDYGKKPDLSRLRGYIDKCYRVHDLKKALRSTNSGMRRSAQEAERIQRTLGTITDEVLEFLVEQARKARTLKWNRDYIVDEILGDEIVIVDRENTGRIKEGHVWTNGLHRFVEIKEFGESKGEGLTSFSYSAQVFYRQYERLYALTGTIGDSADQYELRNKYGLAGFTVPTHHPSKRVDYPLIITATDKERDDIAAKLYTDGEGGYRSNFWRPTLLMFGSIDEAKRYHRQNLHCITHGVQVVTGEFDTNRRKRRKSGHEVFPASEDEAVSQAGEAGMLTVTTPIFGRGTDIIPTAEAIEEGGLMSIQMFLPKNLRVDVQGRGRAGRQGNPGDSYVIASLESDPQLLEMSNITEKFDELFGDRWFEHWWAKKLFFAMREMENVEALIEKGMQLKLDERHHEYQSSYFDAMSRAKRELEQVYRKAKQARRSPFEYKFSENKKVDDIMTEANDRWAYAYTLYNLYAEAVKAPDDIEPIDLPGGEYDRLIDDIIDSVSTSAATPEGIEGAKEMIVQRLRYEYAESLYLLERRKQLLDEIVGGALAEIEALLTSHRGR